MVTCIHSAISTAVDIAMALRKPSAFVPFWYCQSKVIHSYRTCILFCFHFLPCTLHVRNRSVVSLYPSGDPSISTTTSKYCAGQVNDHSNYSRRLGLERFCPALDVTFTFLPPSSSTFRPVYRSICSLGGSCRVTMAYTYTSRVWSATLPQLQHL